MGNRMFFINRNTTKQMNSESFLYEQCKDGVYYENIVSGFSL